jgi:competence protein CoiA
VAFAAIHPEAGRIDATQHDLGCGLSWDAVYKVRPRVALRCPACGHGVHARRSSRQLRHFAHNPGRPQDCAWLNESLEHHLLELELATAIRTVGWHADLEVRASDGSWRADVLAASHDGTRRVAFEAQLSPVTDDDIVERTARYQDEGIGVCWASIADRPAWMGVVPSIQVRDPEDEQPWAVVDGVARFDYPTGSWRVVTVGLVEFIGWVLNEKAIVHPVGHRYSGSGQWPTRASSVVIASGRPRAASARRLGTKTCASASRSGSDGGKNRSGRRSNRPSRKPRPSVRKNNASARSSRPPSGPGGR